MMDSFASVGNVRYQVWLDVLLKSYPLATFAVLLTFQLPTHSLGNVPAKHTVKRLTWCAAIGTLSPPLVCAWRCADTALALGLAQVVYLLCRFLSSSGSPGCLHSAIYLF